MRYGYSYSGTILLPLRKYQFKRVRLESEHAVKFVFPGQKAIWAVNLFARGATRQGPEARKRTSVQAESGQRQRHCRRPAAHKVPQNAQGLIRHRGRICRADGAIDDAYQRVWKHSQPSGTEEHALLCAQTGIERHIAAQKHHAPGSTQHSSATGTIICKKRACTGIDIGAPENRREQQRLPGTVQKRLVFFQGAWKGIGCKRMRATKNPSPKSTLSAAGLSQPPPV